MYCKGDKQQTIEDEIDYSGIALHSGENINIKLKPAEADSGIVFKRVDLPIMVGWKFGPARIQAGPVGTIMLGQTSAIEAAMDGVEEEFNGATWGYQVGVGLDLLNTLTLDAKYEGSLSYLGESVKIGEESFSIDNRPNQFVVTVGIFF